MSTIITHVGLTDKETNLLKSIFGILDSSPRLVCKCEFIDYERKSDEISFAEIDKSILEADPERHPDSPNLADIVFVDADNNDSMIAWDEYKILHPLTTPIFISDNPGRHGHGHISMQRPIVLKRVISSLTYVMQPRQQSSSDNPNSLNVLVVDDSFAIRKYMEHTLPKLVSCSLRLDFASDGEEALDKMKERSYTIVFLDVVMPGIDGYKVCKTIKSQYQSNVVMLTSKKSPYDKVRGTMSGCNAYLTKPPVEAKLQKALEKCLADKSPVLLAVKSA